MYQQRHHTFPQEENRTVPPAALQVPVQLLQQRREPPDRQENAIDNLLSVCSSIVEPMPGVDDDFGRLEWDHTSDVHTPSYDETDDDLSRVATNVALEALAEDDQVFEDFDLFDDDPVSEQNEDADMAMLEDRNQLDLSGDLVQPGRVYRLDNRLAVSSDMFLVKQKRLVGSSSTGGKLRTHKKKKDKSKIQWFVRKLVFSKKPPQDDEDDPSAQQNT